MVEDVELSFKKFEKLADFQKYDESKKKYEEFFDTLAKTNKES